MSATQPPVPQRDVTGGQILVDALQAWGVDTIFGIPGIHTLSVYDALYRHPDIRHILTRHEAGAAFMADGFARASGKIGVVLTTTGPAALNALTPLSGAHAESSPVLLIASGRATTAAAGTGELHEMRDQMATLESVCGQARRVTSLDEIPEAVSEAFTLLHRSRPRPFALEIALDVLDEQGAATPLPPHLPAYSEPESGGAARAIELIRAARRPLLLAGGGSQDAAEQVRCLAERLGAPVGLTINGLGVVPADHGLCLGDAASVTENTGSASVSRDFASCLAASDLLIAVGTRFGERTVRGWDAAPPSLIHIDIDPAVPGSRYPAQAALVGDAAQILSRILGDLGEDDPDTDWDAAAVSAELEPPEDDMPARILRTLRRALDRDAVICNDMTEVCYRAPRWFPVYAPRGFLSPCYSGVLGFALPVAIGAKVACPHRQVVAVCGDGGFLFTAQELSVAMQQDVALPIIVCNDDRYGAIRRVQDRTRGGRHIGVELHNPDFVRFAESFGARGTRVTSCDGLSVALEQALDANGPFLIEIRLPEFEKNSGDSAPLRRTHGR